LVWLVEADDDGWLVDEDWAWFAELEADDGLAEPLEADWFAEAEPEADWFADAEPDWPDDAEAPATEFRPGMSALACFAWSTAACVRGPMMPSTGPGSKPLSFSACWSWRTDSSPWDALPEADAPLVPEALPLADAPLVPEAPLLELLDEPLVALEAMLEDWLAEAEADGWLVDEEDWLAEAEVAGWLDEAEDLSVLDWPAAIAEPAAIRAATRASFLNCMVGILSYGQLTAKSFVAGGASKFPSHRAPSGAGRLRAAHGGPAT
jgi:hypothetical protein